MKVINIAEDFSEFPNLRHCNISDYSGEQFYHELLNRSFKEAFEADDILRVNLDNTAGYASSFLDEAFGNLVYDFTLEVIKNKIEIVSDQEPHWKEMILSQTFTQWEDRRLKKHSPKVTKKHEPWYRLNNNKLELKEWEVPTIA